MKNEARKKIVISLGGSMVVPSRKINIAFLIQLNTFIRKKIKENPSLQFFLVVGGGEIARFYRDAGHDVIGHQLSNDDLDWLGIHATILNAQLVRTIFKDIAHPAVIKHYEIIRRVHEPVVVAAGWKPGWSTDFCNTLICEDYKADTIINLSNIDAVYDSDPRIHKNAKPQYKITWNKFRKLVGDVWIPGMNAPFDPIASKRAQELGIKVIVMKGGDFKNLDNCLNGKKFIGTIIQN